MHVFGLQDKVLPQTQAQVQDLLIVLHSKGWEIIPPRISQYQQQQCCTLGILGYPTTSSLNEVALLTIFYTIWYNPAWDWVSRWILAAWCDHILIAEYQDT